MKKLQNNFTTPEQSKRLLELGVPADSADCIAHIVDNGIDTYKDFVLKGDVRISVINERHTYTKATTLEDGDRWLDEPYPCWSVGRLIEIYEICTQTKFKRVQQADNLVYLSPLEDVLMQIEHNACGLYDNTKWDTNLLKWIKNLLEE
jgi:hypothetical protein